MLQEKVIKGFAGWLMLVLLLLLAVLFFAQFISAARDRQPEIALIAITLAAVSAVCLGGLTVVNPNEARVIVLFGTYKGTVKDPGFWWFNPLTRRRRVSLRVRNFESSKLKVNDHDGNPVEIAAVVVWKVVETAEALFHVDNYENFLKVQTEAAVRNLATSYPYDAHVEGQSSLRGNIVEVAGRLRTEVHERLAQAGLEVIEARIRHL